MTILDISKILDCQIICGQENLNQEVSSACGSDMMSDVLAYVKDHAILLTGLVNAQVVRTADMMDMQCVVFVRKKMPSEDMINLAQERGITLMVTNHRMFTSCGLLWEAGLKGGSKV